LKKKMRNAKFSMEEFERQRLGQVPMDTKKISWWTPRMGGEEERYIQQALEKHHPNEGELAGLFEQKIANLLGCKHAVSVTSGTAAIFLALKSAGIGHGDEVIVPDATFIATVNAVEMCGAKPVLVDVDPQTLNMDPARCLKAITKNTKGIVPVHVSGRAARMNQILRLAKENNLVVVEDAAEAFMSKLDGKYLGTIGDLGCLSFSAHKIITTGQGGIILTNSDQHYQRLKELKDQGRPVRGTGGNDIHHSVGYNFKFTDLQAAVGLGQLHCLQERVNILKSIHESYREQLKEVDGLSLFKFNFNGGELPLWTDILAEKRDELEAYLGSQNINCRKFWLPIHTQAPYRCADDLFPQATKLLPRALWLPSAFTLTEPDIRRVCDLIKNFFKVNSYGK